MDRLQSMRVFQQVVDDGSFARAAQSCGMSAAVVTRLVSDLEEHLGVRLLQRTTRRLALTDAGEAYLARVRHILIDIDEAHGAAQAQAQEMSGVIRVLTPPIFGVHILGPMIARFGRAYPKVMLDIHVHSHDVPPIEDYDLTLLGADETFDANIIARPIASSDGVLCASPGYLDKCGVPQQPEDLINHRCLRFKQAANKHMAWRLINPAEDNRRLDIPLEPALLVNHSDTLIRACVDGAGIASQSIDLITQYLKTGELRRVLAPWITGRHTLYAALPSRKFIPKKTSALLDFLTEHTRAAISKIDTRET